MKKFLLPLVLVLGACASLGTDEGAAAAQKLQTDLATLSADVVAFEIGAAPAQLQIVAQIRGGDYLGALSNLAILAADPQVIKLRADLDLVLADLRAVQGANEAKARAAR